MRVKDYHSFIDVWFVTKEEKRRNIVCSLVFSRMYYCPIATVLAAVAPVCVTFHTTPAKGYGQRRNPRIVSYAMLAYVNQFSLALPLPASDLPILLSP
jgi:hypothetical protein